MKSFVSRSLVTNVILSLYVGEAGDQDLAPIPSPPGRMPHSGLGEIFLPLLLPGIEPEVVHFQFFYFTDLRISLSRKKIRPRNWVLDLLKFAAAGDSPHVADLISAVGRERNNEVRLCEN